MKVLMFCLFLITASTCFAAYQYNDLTEATVSADQYKNRYFEGYAGNYYTPNLNKYASVYIVDDVRSRFSSYDAANRSIANLLTDFGYVDSNGNKISWSGKVITANKIDTVWNGTITQNAYKIGEFSPSDEIKLWLSNKAGEIVYSNTPKLFDYQGGYGLGGYDLFENKLALADFNFGKDVNFSIAVNYDNTAVSGQPLPSTGVSILISSVFLGFIYLFKRNKTLLQA